MNTDTKTMFDQLNRFRVRNGKKPLKAWKESKDKLVAALNAEAPKEDFEAPASELKQQQTRQHVIEARPVEHNPTPEKAAAQKAARLENERKNAKLEEMEKAQPSPSAKKERTFTKRDTVPELDRAIKSTKKKSAPKQKASISASQVLQDIGIDPKQGRALLRKHNVERTADAIRKFFADRSK